MLHTIKKRAFITGITGQDGSYLAEYLLKKKYKVFGLVRNKRSSLLTNIAGLLSNKDLVLIKGDMKDKESIIMALKIACPDEVYNLAAQTDSPGSFLRPKETFDINYRAVGWIISEAIKVNSKVKIFQASSSEIFGKSRPPQSEKTQCKPVTPYGEAKLKAHRDFVIDWRKKRKIFVCSGILFNHESPRRSEKYVTRKISLALVRIKLGLQDFLELGNLDATRDWGYAGDYVEAMWSMLQRTNPDDYVIASGEVHTIRQFVNEAAKVLAMKITWSGIGLDEVGYDVHNKPIVKINKDFYRPVGIDYTLGDNKKARKILGWSPKCNFKKLVRIMVMADLKRIKKQ